MIKVMNYLEQQLLYTSNIDEYNKYRKFLFDNYGVIHVEMFYNQKFQPELIVQLFEGWEIISVENPINIIFKNNEREIVYWYNLIENSCLPYLEINGRNFPHPKTLNDFILFCQYANIELIPKEVSNG